MAFRPMTDLMPLEEYVDFLREMDVLIMPFTNPQAGYNCTFALSVGSKVFLRPENTYLKRYQEHGCHLFEFSELESQRFESLAEPLAESIQRANFAGIQSIQDMTRRGWNDIFTRLVPTQYQRQWRSAPDDRWSSSERSQCADLVGGRNLRPAGCPTCSSMFCSPERWPHPSLDWWRC